MNRKSEAKEKQIFRIYYGMGNDRSLPGLASRLEEDYKKMGLKSPPALGTLNRWSSEYGWAERVKQWDAKVSEKLDQKALDRAVISNIQILKITTAVILTFAKNLKGRILKNKDGQPVLDEEGNPIMDYDIKITPSDFKMMYELQQEILAKQPINAWQLVINKVVEEIRDLPENTQKQIMQLIDEISELQEKAENEAFTFNENGV